MKNKISIFFAALLIIALLSALPAFATLIYDGTNAELEAQGYVGITTESELKSVKGKVYLKNDIVLTSGVGGTALDAIINGNGHTVYLNGGFSVINSGKNVTAENLVLAGDVVLPEGFFEKNGIKSYGPLSVGGIDGILFLKNVRSHVNITVQDTKISGAIGGVMGAACSEDTILENVLYSGKLDTGNGEMVGTEPEERAIGGIFGAFSTKVKCTDVFANAEITVGNKNVSAVGGLFGMITDEGVIRLENGSFNGSLTVTGEVDEEYGVGGIVGSVARSETWLARLTNNADITLTNKSCTAPLGGVAGRVNGGGVKIIFARAVNNGQIKGTNIAGGVVGELSTADTQSADTDNLIFEQTINTSNVTASLFAGGIMGKVKTNSILVMSHAINISAISATDKENGKAAGIIGDLSAYISRSASFSNIFNTGDVSAANAAPICGLDTKKISAEQYSCYYSNDFEGYPFGRKKTFEEIEALRKEINFNLVDTTDLSEALHLIEKKVQEDYTKESWKNLLNVINAGYDILHRYDVTQAEIDAAVTAVIAAIDALESKYTDVEGENEEDKALNTQAASPFADKSADGGVFGCGAAITASTVIFIATLALGAGVAFKKKEN